jgi:hypothetical protein
MLIYRPSDRTKHKFKFRQAETINHEYLKFFIEKDNEN